MNSSSSKKNKSPQPWKLLSSIKALNERWFMVRQDTVELPSGKVVDDYYIWESPDIATIVPITADGKFVMCEQYRHAINTVLLQFPAGGVGNNETPQQAALREMEEETGYKGGKVTKLATVSVYPTKLTGLNYLFMATNVQPEGVKHDDEMEETRVVLKSSEELWALIHGDEVQIADSTAAALLALKKLGL